MKIGTLISTVLALFLAGFGVISWWIPLLIFLTGVELKLK